MVEAGGQIATDFDMLYLICTDGDGVGIVGQDVGGHQDGISEQAGVGGEAFSNFIFVGGATFQQAHRAPDNSSHIS